MVAVQQRRRGVLVSLVRGQELVGLGAASQGMVSRPGGVERGTVLVRGGLGLAPALMAR